MKYAIMVLALVGVLAQPTAAIAATGNEMFGWCKQSASLCVGYAWGWRNGHDVANVVTLIKKGLSEANAHEALSRETPTGICFPNVSTSKQ